jgi:hypothetical protein
MRGCTWHRRLSLSVAVLLLLIALPPPARAQALDCTGYDSQIWAQSIFESDPTRYASLDPDSNGLACEDVPPCAAPAS